MCVVHVLRHPYLVQQCGELGFGQLSFIRVLTGWPRESSGQMFNRSLNHQSFFSIDTGRFPHLQEVALSGSLKRRTQCLEPRIDQHLQQ